MDGVLDLRDLPPRAIELYNRYAIMSDAQLDLLWRQNKFNDDPSKLSREHKIGVLADTEYMKTMH